MSDTVCGFRRKQWAIKLLNTLALVLLLFVGVSCAPHRMMVSPSGMIVPEHPSWSVKNYTPSAASCVPDPNALYVSHYSREQMSGRRETLVDGYHFYRLWPNGRLLYRNQIEGQVPTAEDGDTFQRMGMLSGRYSITGDEITTETFNFLGEYERHKGSISAGGIVIHPVHGGYGGGRYERVQFPRGAMQKQPDW